MPAAQVSHLHIPWKASRCGDPERCLAAADLAAPEASLPLDLPTLLSFRFSKQDSLRNHLAFQVSDKEGTPPSKQPSPDLLLKRK